MRICNDCGGKKELTEFYVNSRCTGGRISVCRACCKDKYRSSKMKEKRPNALVADVKSIRTEPKKRPVPPQVTITRNGETINTTHKRLGYDA